MPASKAWPPGRLAILSSMWKSGSTGGEIALRLGVSRSAVSGRVRRLNLTRNPTKPPALVVAASKPKRAAPKPKGPKQALPPVDRLWSLDESKRRDAFARRAAAGARETLEAAGL